MSASGAALSRFHRRQRQARIRQPFRRHSSDSSGRSPTSRWCSPHARVLGTDEAELPATSRLRLQHHLTSGLSSVAFQRPARPLGGDLRQNAAVLKKVSACCFPIIAFFSALVQFPHPVRLLPRLRRPDGNFPARHRGRAPVIAIGSLFAMGLGLPSPPSTCLSRREQSTSPCSSSGSGSRRSSTRRARCRIRALDPALNPMARGTGDGRRSSSSIASPIGRRLPIRTCGDRARGWRA